MSNHITVFEMGPRDGLQNEKRMVPTHEKINLINQLSECGFRKIEATSFVSPKWVPQMADASDVMAGIERRPEVDYAALTPNIKGFEAAMKAQVNEVAIFAAATESFSQKNINCSIDESITRFKPLVATATKAGIPVRGYVSCFVHCPYEGSVSSSKVISVTQRLLDLGCYEISLGDTTGKGRPEVVAAMLDAILQTIPANKLAGHFHDTDGFALENIDLSLQHGLRTFDAAVAGLGGCPYSPGAKGNVSTHAVIQLLHDKGYATGIDSEKLQHVENYVLDMLRDIT